MKRRAAGATILLLLAGAALAAPTGARAADPKPAPGRSEPASFWEKLRIRGRDKAAEKEAADAPRAVARTQARLRSSAIAREAECKAWLDIVDRGQAGAKEFNDFAAYLVRKAHFAEASVYQKAAIDREPRNASLWVNFAMIERSAGRPASVRGACERALSLDPNHALAHYVLGTVHDENRKFERAIEEYRTALLLDPRLGDASFNPLVADNAHINLVKMLNYRDQAGSVGLPIVTMTPGPPPASSKPGQPATPPKKTPEKR